MTTSYEKSIIGSLFLEPTAFKKISEIVEPKDFSNPVCRWAFKTFRDRLDSEQPIDFKILMDLIPQKSRTKYFDFLTKLMDEAVTSATAPYFAGKLREESIKEGMRKALDDGADPETLLTLSQQLADIRNPTPKSQSIIESADIFAVDYQEPAPVIAGGILPEGGGLILAGESGEGKSLMRLELALHMALGMDCWNLGIPTQRRVFIIQFENTQGQERFRLGRMLHGLEIDNKDIQGRLAFSDPTIRFDLGLKGERKRALELVEKSKADVVVWDPLSSLHTKNENDNVEIRAVLDSITAINRQTGTTSIVVHHFGKPQQDQKLEHRTRGASSIRDWADTLAALSRKPHAHKTQRLLTFVKVRNGPHRPDILLERDDHFLHHPVDEDSLCPPEQVRDVLIDLGGEVSMQTELANAIREATGCGEKSSRLYIKNAEDRGLIKRTGEGKRKGFVVWK